MTYGKPLATRNLAWALVACLAPVAAQAQHVQVAPATRPANWHNEASRIDMLEAELSELRTRLETYSSHGGSSCDSGCDPCAQTCCRPCGLYGGAEVVWIRPHFEDESAWLTDGSTLDEIVAFDYDYDATPRIWLGYTNCDGLGGRVRYWTYDNNFSRNAVAAGDVEAFAYSNNGQLQRRLDGNPNDTIFARHDLELDVIDFEATQQFDFWSTLVMASVGGRYVRTEQEYEVIFTDPLGPQDRLFHSHGFDGIGPTIGLELWRPLNYGFSLYGATRGSILFGEVDQQIVEAVPGNTFTERRQNVDESLAIGEVALGLQWTGGWLYNSNLFVRGGWEGQYWHGAGNANTTDSNLALEGFFLGLGVMR